MTTVGRSRGQVEMISKELKAVKGTMDELNQREPVCTTSDCVLSGIIYNSIYTWGEIIVNLLNCSC